MVTTDNPISGASLYVKGRFRYLSTELTIFFNILQFLISYIMSSAQSRLNSVMGHLASPVDGKATLLQKNPDDIVGCFVVYALIMLLRCARLSPLPSALHSQRPATAA